MVALIVNLHKAAQHPLIGHGDHEESLEAITARMNRAVLKIDKKDLEAGLWACNMLHELDEFWSPFTDASKVKNYTEFSRFLDRLPLPYGFKFDRFFNQIIDKRRTKTK